MADDDIIGYAVKALWPARKGGFSTSDEPELEAWFVAFTDPSSEGVDDGYFQHREVVSLGGAYVPRDPAGSMRPEITRRTVFKKREQAFRIASAARECHHFPRGLPKHVAVVKVSRKKVPRGTEHINGSSTP